LGKSQQNLINKTPQNPWENPNKSHHQTHKPLGKIPTIMAQK
jgi:hypothetical protein